MIKLVFLMVLLHFSQNVLYKNAAQFDTAIFTDIQDEIGKEFLFSNCKSLTGEEYNSQSLKGKYTLINFWFEACEPCIAEFDKLNKIYNKYRTDKKFKLISFTFESPENAAKIAKEYSIIYPIICISRDKCYKLNFNHGFPTNIITDSLGKVASITVGGSIDPKEVDKDLDNTIILKIEELIRNKF